jgi:tRNA(Ile)-lysidine synthase
MFVYISQKGENVSSHRSVESSFIESVRLRNLLPEGSRIVAAVSGGSDSVALVRLLCRFADHMNWELTILHIDHHARPESGEDALFVKNLAAELGLPFSLEGISTAATGSPEGYFSAERNRIYREYSSEGALIVTGHTASDRAETLLMRLLEGAGLRGLGGMDYFGLGNVRRPLLDFRGIELRKYLESYGQSWIEDPTNEQDEYLRNRIRHRVIPILESISPGSTAAIARSSGNLSQWRDITDRVVEDSMENLFEGDSFSREQYIELPRVVRLAILWSSCGRPRSGRSEFEKTDRWILEKKSGSHLLPGGSEITAEGSRIRIERSGKKRDKELN